MSAPFQLAAVVAACSFAASADPCVAPVPDKASYVHAITRGGGLMPWQSPGLSEAEAFFRRSIEERKSRMLRDRLPVEHPVLLTEKDIARARRNISSSEEAGAWFAALVDRAEFLAGRPDSFIDDMIAEETPWHTYGFTCPNCVGTKSQEGAGAHRGVGRSPAGRVPLHGLRTVLSASRLPGDGRTPRAAHGTDIRLLPQ